MNHYEEYIIKLQRRIKKIEDNPDPKRLRTTKIRYELQLEEAKEQLEAWRQGRPFSDGDGFVAGRLARAMGFTPTGSVGTAMQTMTPQKYLEHASERGLPVDNSCDMTMMPFAMQECGDVPMEDLSLCNQHTCIPMMLRGIYVAHATKNFTYYVDIPFEENDANLTYVTDQLGEFIEFAEWKFPGVIKYEEEKLVEMQEFEEASRELVFEMYKMRRNKPSPLGGLDAFSGGAGGASSAKGLEIVKARRDELVERVEKGMAAVPGEQLRMLWTVTRPYFMNPCEVLEKRKVALIFYYSGIAHLGVPLPRHVYFGGRKLTPIEKVAAQAISALWAGPQTRWIDNLLWICRDLEIDAIINYNMLGCTATLGLKKIVEERAEKELGIPTLQLEGSQWNSNYASKVTINAKLDDFAQMCLSQKGLS